MAALTVLIIRHGEKTGEQWPGPGLTKQGVPNNRSLVVRGWQRAGAWAALFGSDLGGADYLRPHRIFAVDPKGDPREEPTKRPYQTVTPLAARLGFPIDKRVQGQEVELAAEINALTDGVVLVCWEHKHIGGALLPALLGKNRPAGVPRAWQGSRFDIVLRLDRASPEAAWEFRQLLPCLLSGDRDEPM
jgi:hypothetical protein